MEEFSSNQIPSLLKGDNLQFDTMKTHTDPESLLSKDPSSEGLVPPCNPPLVYPL